MRSATIAVLLLLGASPASATDEPFGLRFRDPAIVGEPLDTPLMRTLRVHWDRAQWPSLRVVRAREPLGRLKHYVARIGPKTGICSVTAFSDPIARDEEESELKPILLDIANELEVIFGAYQNAYDQIEDPSTGNRTFSEGRIAFRSWERMREAFETRNWLSLNVASWPRSVDEKLGPVLNRAWLSVRSDPDRRLRASVRIVANGDC